jgi:hypothetical protein
MSCQIPDVMHKDGYGARCKQPCVPVRSQKLLSTAAGLRAGVRIKDRRQRLRLYSACFVGSQGTASGQGGSPRRMCGPGLCTCSAGRGMANLPLVQGHSFWSAATRSLPLLPHPRPTAVTWLVETRAAGTREEAVVLGASLQRSLPCAPQREPPAHCRLSHHCHPRPTGNQMMAAGLFHHVSYEQLFRDADYLYRCVQARGAARARSGASLPAAIHVTPSTRALNSL